MTRKWIKVNDLSGGQYSGNKNIRIKTPMLRSNLCNYSDAYIVVKEVIDILAAATNENYNVEKILRFKIMNHLGSAYKKLTTHLQTMQKILV